MPASMTPAPAIATSRARRPCGLRPGRRPRATRRVSRSPAASSRRCTAAGSGRCGSTPGSARRPSRTGATATCSAQGVSGLSVAFDLPTQMGYDSDHPLAAGEVGRVGVAIDSLEDMAALFDGIPLDRVSTSMTINATAIILLALYVAVARAPGRRARGALGHGPERHPQGIHRARHLHLPAAAVAAHRHRHLRVLRARAAALEHDLDQRLSHPRGGLDGRAGGGVHASPTRIAYVQAAIDARARRRTRSASGSRSSSTRTTTSSRRSRSSAPRGGCGRASCATGSARRIRARSSCASTRRPPAARSPRSSPTTTSSASRCRRWPRCSAARSRCTATAATRRWRCRPRNRRAIALRTQQIIAHETGVANTVDPVGGVVRDRGS